MGMQTYALTPGRIEKFKGDIIETATATERLAKAGRQVPMPKNNSKTYVARKYAPWGSTATKAGHNIFFPTDNTQAGVNRGLSVINAHASSDGVTAAADSVAPIDYTATIQEYQCLFSFTNQTEDFYEDNIPEIMKQQVAHRVTLVNEMVIYGALQGCTNVYYGGTGTSISTVNDRLTLPLIRKIVRNLQANHANPVTSILGAGRNFSTEPVGSGYLVYVHTDLEPDVRDLTGFIPTHKYASDTPMPNEIGAVERFRFIGCPDLPAILSAGASTVTYTALQTSTATAQADVYPIIVMGENAFSQIAFKGRASSDATFFAANEKSKSDPHGQRGYAGLLWYKQCLIENDNWMAVSYVGTQKL